MESNCNASLLEFIKQFSTNSSNSLPDDVNKNALNTNMQVVDDIIFEVIMRSVGGV